MSKIGKIFGSIGDLFGGKKKKAPIPLPAIPTREDPTTAPKLEAAKKAAQDAARVRVGRSKSVLTSGAGLEDDEDVIKRVGARRAKLLGN